MMESSFHTGQNLTNFLFGGLNITKPKDFAAVCMVLIVMVCLLEAVKLLSAYLYYYGNKKTFEHTHRYQAPDESSPLVLSAGLPEGLDYIKKIKLRSHFGQSLLHVAELTLAYIIMLAVMSFDTWIFLSVVLGSGFGYFVFAVFRQRLRYPQQCLPPQQPVAVES